MIPFHLNIALFESSLSARPTWIALTCAALLLACGEAADPGATAGPDGAAAVVEVEAEALAPVSLPAPHSEPAGPSLERSTRPRGLWVLAEGSERVLDDPAKVPALVDHAVALGATDLFVQVYRGGRAWYDATLADPTPFKAVHDATGVDPLADLLERAHAAGLKVHAWVNVLSLSQNRDAPIIDELGRQSILVDRRGRSMLDYPALELPDPDRGWYRMGTRGVYLDAGAPGVRDRLTSVFEELIVRYPTLDGLHLDYIRHPGALPFVPGSRFGVGIDFGYGAGTRARFREETGVNGPYATPDEPATSKIVHAHRWDDWRRAQVTELVRSIREQTQIVKPDLVISAAVNSYVDRAYLSLAQDWKRWLEEGLIDLAIPMVYTLDDRLLRYQLDHFATAPDHERVWPGIGVWLHARRPGEAIEQIGIAREAGAPGEVLFSYDSIVAAPGLQAALEEAAQSDVAAR